MFGSSKYFDGEFDNANQNNIDTPSWQAQAPQTIQW